MPRGGLESLALVPSPGSRTHDRLDVFAKVGETPPVLYVVCGAMDEDYLPVFYEWYARKHAPDVIALGFWSARSYLGVDSSHNVWDLYEIAGPDVFDRPEYAAMSRGDPAVAEALAHFGQRTVTLYDQVSIEGAKAPLTGPALTAVRFDRDGEDAVAAEHATAVVRPLVRSPGFVCARLYRRSERQHPWWPTSEPEWCAVVEWESVDRAAGAHGREDATAAYERLGADRVSYNLVRLHYGLVRDDAWN